MFYPTNYPIELEKSYLELLLSLQKNHPSLKSAHSLTQAIHSYLKSQHQNSQQTPPLWHLKFILERHRNQFTPEFYQQLDPLLKKTKVRSHSGIIPVSVFTNGVGCPFNCVYCANEPSMPKSYFSDEPAVMRAIRNDFDPFKQTFNRLQMLYLSGHPIDKIELIIQGGTFSFYDMDYREWFVKRCFDAANLDLEKVMRSGQRTDYESKSVEEAQATNETAKNRVIGLTIETRPDFINIPEARFLRKLGVTRIEMGVQAPDETILKLINRGHGLKEIVEATGLLKDTGFKLTYHLMPGLPGSTPSKDLSMLKDIFTNPNYKPDNIKFYPTSVVKHSLLAEWYREGKYTPYNEEDLTNLVVDFKQKIVPPWVRIQRLVRDLTVNDMVVDSFPSNLRQKIETKMKTEKIKCPCIRCREIKSETKEPELKLEVINYEANGGQEYFLQFADRHNRLYGLLRLRLSQNTPFNELKEIALIRELHVYGEALSLGERHAQKSQHQGLGKQLMLKAEEIARQAGYTKIAVIAGIGTREYYRRLGYRLEHTYMLKSLL